MKRPKLEQHVLSVRLHGALFNEVNKVKDILNSLLPPWRKQYNTASTVIYLVDLGLRSTYLKKDIKTELKNGDLK